MIFCSGRRLILFEMELSMSHVSVQTSYWPFEVTREKLDRCYVELHCGKFFFFYLILRFRTGSLVKIPPPPQKTQHRMTNLSRNDLNMVYCLCSSACCLVDRSVENTKNCCVSQGLGRSEWERTLGTILVFTAMSANNTNIILPR